MWTTVFVSVYKIMWCKQDSEMKSLNDAEHVPYQEKWKMIQTVQTLYAIPCTMQQTHMNPIMHLLSDTSN